MADPSEVISLFVAAEFVVASALVLLLVPLETALPVIPLLLVFLLALPAYHS